jgi:hypothetical protein
MVVCVRWNQMTNAASEVVALVFGVWYAERGCKMSVVDEKDEIGP